LLPGHANAPTLSSGTVEARAAVTAAATAVGTVAAATEGVATVAVMSAAEMVGAATVEAMAAATVVAEMVGEERESATVVVKAAAETVGAAKVEATAKAREAQGIEHRLDKARAQTTLRIHVIHAVQKGCIEWIGSAKERLAQLLSHRSLAAVALAARGPGRHAKGAASLICGWRLLRETPFVGRDRRLTPLAAPHRDPRSVEL
jgi:hypothetical protein